MPGGISRAKLPSKPEIISRFRELGWSIEAATVVADHMHAGTDDRFTAYLCHRLFGIDMRYRTPSKKTRIPQSIRKQVFERDAYRCQVCNDWHNLTVDHIVPESRGGGVDLDDLQTLCRSCNSKKGTR